MTTADWLLLCVSTVRALCERVPRELRSASLWVLGSFKLQPSYLFCTLSHLVLGTSHCTRLKPSSDVAAFASRIRRWIRRALSWKECRELNSSRFIHPHCFAITLSVFIAGRGGLAAMGPFKPLGALINGNVLEAPASTQLNS